MYTKEEEVYFQYLAKIEARLEGLTGLWDATWVDWSMKQQLRLLGCLSTDADVNALIRECVEKWDDMQMSRTPRQLWKNN